MRSKAFNIFDSSDSFLHYYSGYTVDYILLGTYPIMFMKMVGVAIRVSIECRKEYEES